MSTDNHELVLPGTIGKLQACVKAILEDEDSEMDERIPVLCENQQDIVQRINETVAQVQPGICAVVRSPAFVSSNAGSVLYFNDVSVIVRVIENVLLNRAQGGTKIPAQLAAEQIARTINNAVPAGFGAALYVRSVLSVTDARSTGVLMYEVAAKTAAGFDDEPEQGEE